MARGTGWGLYGIRGSPDGPVLTLTIGEAATESAPHPVLAELPLQSRRVRSYYGSTFTEAAGRGLRGTVMRRLSIMWEVRCVELRR